MYIRSCYFSVFFFSRFIIFIRCIDMIETKDASCVALISKRFFSFFQRKHNYFLGLDLKLWMFSYWDVFLTKWYDVWPLGLFLCVSLICGMSSNCVLNYYYSQDYKCGTWTLNLPNKWWFLCDIMLVLYIATTFGETCTNL